MEEFLNSEEAAQITGKAQELLEERDGSPVDYLTAGRRAAALSDYMSSVALSLRSKGEIAFRTVAPHVSSKKMRILPGHAPTEDR